MSNPSPTESLFFCNKTFLDNISPLQKEPELLHQVRSQQKIGTELCYLHSDCRHRFANVFSKLFGKPQLSCIAPRKKCGLYHAAIEWLCAAYEGDKNLLSIQ